MDTRWIDRAENQLMKDYEDGSLSTAEYNEAMRDLHRDVRAAEEEDMERAQQAVRDEYGGW